MTSYKAPYSKIEINGNTKNRMEMLIKPYQIMPQQICVGHERKGSLGYLYDVCSKEVLFPLAFVLAT